jgi:hypothetical protein
MTYQFDLTTIIVGLIGLLAAIISFFSVRMIKQVDESQKQLWQKFDNHETRLSHLEGEHKAFTK